MRDSMKYLKRVLAAAFVTQGLYFWPICPEFIKSWRDFDSTVEPQASFSDLIPGRFVVISSPMGDCNQRKKLPNPVFQRTLFLSPKHSSLYIAEDFCMSQRVPVVQPKAPEHFESE